MSPILQLRTYTLRSASAAQAYVPYWRNHKRTFQQTYNIKTLGVYTSPTSPTKVIALVQLPEGSMVDEVMGKYTKSEQFKKDLEGFDLSQFVSVVGEVLEPVEYSPDRE